MKPLLPILLSLLLSTSAFCQSAVDSSSKSKTPMRVSLSIGYGFGLFEPEAWYSEEIPYDHSSVFGPCYFKTEIAITHHFGVGMNAMFFDEEFDVPYQYYGYANHIDSMAINAHLQILGESFIARFNFHLFNLQRVDPYFGFGIGYRHLIYRYADENPNHDLALPFNDYFFYDHGLPWALEATIGCRVMFTKAVGFYAETGIAASGLQTGMTINF